MWSRLKLMFLMIVFMTFSAVVWGQSVTSDDKLRIEQKPERFSPSDLSGAEHASHRAFLNFSTAFTSRLHSLLDGQLNQAWTITIILTCHPNHKEDVVMVKITNGPGVELKDYQSHKILKRAKKAAKDAEGFAVLIKTFDLLLQTPGKRQVPGYRASTARYLFYCKEIISKFYNCSFCPIIKAVRREVKMSPEKHPDYQRAASWVLGGLFLALATTFVSQWQKTTKDHPLLARLKDIARFSGGEVYTGEI